MDDIEPGRIYYMSYIHDLINENRVDQGLMEISPWSTRKRIREYDKANP